MTQAPGGPPTLANGDVPEFDGTLVPLGAPGAPPRPAPAPTAEPLPQTLCQALLEAGARDREFMAQLRGFCDGRGAPAYRIAVTPESTLVLLPAQ